MAEVTAQAILDSIRLPDGGPVERIASRLLRPIVAQPLPVQVVNGRERPVNGFSSPGLPFILVNSQHPPTRRAFAAAHEIIELHLTVPYENETVHEAFCCRAGAALMMPRHRFYDALHRHQWDLRGLCSEFPWMSPEAVARRCADLFSSVQMAAWHELRPRYRQYDPNEPDTPGRHLAEPQAVSKSYSSAGYAVVDHSDARVRALRTSGSALRAVSICTFAGTPIVP